MSTYSKLRTQAILAAKKTDWHAAVAINEQILTSYPDDVGSYNRLGLAQLQLGDRSAAKTSFSKALEIDRSNAIAKKQLERISSKKTTTLPSFSTEHFIEEPGRTKIVELHRLAGKQVLEELSVGSHCKLVAKKRYISVETLQGTYIGALPEDISFRLIKLIESGNVYACMIQKITSNQCSVYLKETHRSPANLDTHSFPPGKINSNSVLDIDDRFLMEDEMAVEDSDDEEDVDKPFDSSDAQVQL